MNEHAENWERGDDGQMRRVLPHGAVLERFGAQLEDETEEPEDACVTNACDCPNCNEPADVRNHWDDGDWAEV